MKRYKKDRGGGKATAAFLVAVLIAQSAIPTMASSPHNELLPTVFIGGGGI